MMPPKYQWLLFDVDDTLFNFTLAESRSLEMTFADLGLTYVSAAPEVYHEVNRATWEEFERGLLTSQQLRTRRFERLFERLGIFYDPEKFSARYLKNLGKCSDLVEGAEEMIRTLAPAYRMGLVTNGLADVQRPRLEGSTLKEFFEVVVISEEIGVAKPDPRFFDVAFERMGQPEKSTVLVIGDSATSDIQGAFNYGLDACRFNPRGLPVDARFPVVKEISAWAELTEWLKK